MWRGGPGARTNGELHSLWQTIEAKIAQDGSQKGSCRCCNRRAVVAKIMETDSCKSDKKNLHKSKFIDIAYKLAIMMGSSSSGTKRVKLNVNKVGGVLVFSLPQMKSGIRRTFLVISSLGSLLKPTRKL